MGPGKLVAANVRLERMLSEGGMGSVWVADHLTLNTKVAVKFMTAEMAAHPEALSRFKREASASARVKSPHIVQVFDHGVTEDAVPYIVMELLQGEDLEARLKRGVLTLGDTLEVTRQILKALGSAHREGVIHRDIKPPNIFLLDVDGDVFVKVLDFGIAKQTSDDGLATQMTRNGAMLGTPHYMSPEQMLGSLEIDARSDLWAVGVVAYRALTGIRPFDGETIGALSVAINAAQFIAPSSLVEGLPGAVDAWFSRALARLPEARFATAREMADALTEAVPRDQRSRRPPALDSSTMAVGDVTTAQAEDSTSGLSGANTLIAVTDPLGTIEPPRPRRRPAPALAIMAGMVLAVGGSFFFYASKHAASAPASAVQDVVAPTASASSASAASSSLAPSSSSSVGSSAGSSAASSASAPVDSVASATATGAPPNPSIDNARVASSTSSTTNATRAPRAHAAGTGTLGTSGTPGTLGAPARPTSPSVSTTAAAPKDRGF